MSGGVGVGMESVTCLDVPQIIPCRSLRHRRRTCHPNFPAHRPTSSTFFTSFSETRTFRRPQQPVRNAKMPPPPPSFGDGVYPRLGSLGTDEPHAEVADTALLSAPLPAHPTLRRGQLRNGLRFVVLPNNKAPPNRFEAHMDVRVGSIDEDDDEQGIAHMLEHVVEIRRKKKKKLRETRYYYNAYTGFSQTVYHINSLTTTKESDEDLLPYVLAALNQLTFQPKICSSTVEKERKIILSELQMYNTIDYRCFSQLYRDLYSENKLSKRFPIGLEEQIKKWDKDKIRKFHKRWYFPGNATLYIVGDFDNISKRIDQIERLSTPVKRSTILKWERQALRPPILHNWSLPGNNIDLKPPQIFQHDLLHNFSFEMVCKIPVSKIQTYGDIRNCLMKDIYLSALQFRMTNKSSNLPLTSIGLDHQDLKGEGCTVSTLSVTAEPKNWQSALKVAVREVRRLKEFGITKGELTRYMEVSLKYSEYRADMIGNVSSVDNLDFIMECDALGHTVMDLRQEHESFVAVAGTVTLEEVNALGAKVLEFVSDYGKPTAPLPAAILACAPKKVHVECKGETEFTISPIEITDAIKSGLVEPIVAEPDLEVPKELISSSQLQGLWRERSPSFIPPSPKTNKTESHDKETGITQRRLSNGVSVNYKISKNEALRGAMQLIVGGGRATESSESRGAVVVGVETLFEGGRVGKFSSEQVELFCVNHLIDYYLESGNEFIALEFCFSLRDNGMRAAFQLLHMMLEHSVWLEDAFDRARQYYLSDYHSISKSLKCSSSHKIMLAMLDGDERFVEPTPKSLQNLNLQTVKDAVMDQFVGHNMELNIVGDFSEEDIESCILDYIGTVRATRNSKTVHSYEPIIFRSAPSGLQSQQVFLKDTDKRSHAYIFGLTPNRWGFTVDGKGLFESISSNVTTDSPDSSKNKRKTKKIKQKKITTEDEQPKSETLRTKSVKKLNGHPLFFDITMRLLAEIIDSRLFKTLRWSLALTYDVSFDINLFDRLTLGWYIVSITSTPTKIHKAVDACKNVLRRLHSKKITTCELEKAKRVLSRRHEAEIKSNEYWLELMKHLQSSSVPRKDISCTKDLTSLYKAASIEDIYVAYDHLKVNEDSLYSCIGIAGPEDDQETKKKKK